MDLFDSKVVVGLFDNDEDLDQAVAKLQEHGFGQGDDEIQLVDGRRLPQETPASTQNQRIVVSPATGSGGQLAGSVAAFDLGDADMNETNLETRLTEMGVDNEEATFYARQVKRGNALVIVETDEEERGIEALNIMKQANAKGSIS
jgi:hypothetical protein